MQKAKKIYLKYKIEGEMTKPIELKDKQTIGNGAYAKVYKISPRRVVKVYYDEDDKIINKLINDEIKGSKRLFNLPVLKVVKVKIGNKIKQGLVKRFIPNTITFEELCSFAKKNNLKYWDMTTHNFRKDSKGNIYMIDSQTSRLD